jgi:tetratricopeptide (TPR) repeat protein
VRLIITFRCFIVFLFSVGCAAWADTIQLKNGQSIVADSTREINGQVEYTIGENTYAIPQSLVLKIEHGPGVAPGAGVAPSVPSSVTDVPPAREQMKTATDLVGRVVRNGQIDPAALRAIEKEGVAENSAAANLIAANFEEEHKNLDGAARYLQAALTYMPSHVVLLENYAAVLLQLGRPGEALPYAQQATQSNPQSAEAFAVLGYAWYKNDRNRDAIIAWKKSLQLRPSDRVRELLAHVERESAAEAEFRQQASDHFVLRYEGSQAQEGLRTQVLSVLEAQYAVLRNDLGAAPRDIYVSLYTGQAFFDVTQAPAWSAALNDGKIRVPVSGMSEVTPELARVLRHELTHSFVAQIVHGHAPQWLDEGLAQLEEGRTTASVGPRLAALYVSGNQVPLNRLEGLFAGYSAPEAQVAYAEALAAAEYIRNRYGMSDLARILERIGQGESVETALRNTIHIGYAQLEIEITNYLKRNYAQ